MGKNRGRSDDYHQQLTLIDLGDQSPSENPRATHQRRAAAAAAAQSPGERRAKVSYQLSIGLPNLCLFDDLELPDNQQQLKATTPRAAKYRATRRVGSEETRGRWRRTETGWVRKSRRGPLHLTRDARAA